MNFSKDDEGATCCPSLNFGVNSRLRCRAAVPHLSLAPCVMMQSTLDVGRRMPEGTIRRVRVLEKVIHMQSV